MDIDEIDEAYSLYMIEHNKNMIIAKSSVNLFFDAGQHTEYVTARIFHNRTRIRWKEFLSDVISAFSNIGHKFGYVREMNLITTVDKRDRTYDFYIKHNLHAVEWVNN